MKIKDSDIEEEFFAELDSKKRILIKGDLKYKNYNVKRYDNGVIVMEPRVVVHPDKVGVKVKPIKWGDEFQSKTDCSEWNKEDEGWTYRVVSGWCAYGEFVISLGTRFCDGHKGTANIVKAPFTYNGRTCGQTIDEAKKRCQEVLEEEVMKFLED
jgi:hypothetical protein